MTNIILENSKHICQGRAERNDASPYNLASLSALFGGGYPHHKLAVTVKYNFLFMICIGSLVGRHDHATECRVFLVFFSGYFVRHLSFKCRSSTFFGRAAKSKFVYLNIPRIF